MSNLRAPRPARLPHPKPTNINPKDSRYERGTTGGQVTGGATFATAVQIAETAAPGTVILAMLPDTGERYFSTPLFEGVNEGSDDDWLSGLSEAALP